MKRYNLTAAMKLDDELKAVETFVRASRRGNSAAIDLDMPAGPHLTLRITTIEAREIAERYAARLREELVALGVDFSVIE
jgi:hypothetical protein